MEEAHPGKFRTSCHFHRHREHLKNRSRCIIPDTFGDWIILRSYQYIFPLCHSRTLWSDAMNRKAQIPSVFTLWYDQKKYQMVSLDLSYSYLFSFWKHLSNSRNSCLSLHYLIQQLSFGQHIFGCHCGPIYGCHLRHIGYFPQTKERDFVGCS